MLLRSGITKTGPHRATPVRANRAASQIALRAIADEAPRVGDVNLPVSLEAFDDKLQATWRSAEVSGACRALNMQLALQAPMRPGDAASLQRSQFERAPRDVCPYQMSPAAATHATFGFARSDDTGAALQSS